MTRVCERALFDLRTSLGAATAGRDARVGLRALELLEGVLADWREASAALEGTQPFECELLPTVHSR
jgi:hypothetical protein